MYTARIKARHQATRREHHSPQEPTPDPKAEEELIHSLQKLMIPLPTNILDTSTSDSIPTQDSETVPKGWNGFRHPQIDAIAKSKVTPENLREDAETKFLSLISIINNKLTRANMRKEPNAVDESYILKSLDAMRVAAECLMHHFSGIFSRQIGIDQVTSWSKTEVVPQEYFVIIKNALDYQACANESTQEENIEPGPDIPSSFHEPSQVTTDPYAITPEILRELDGVEPLPMHAVPLFSTSSSFIPQNLRKQKLQKIYATARHSHIQLVNIHHEQPFYRRQIIDFALETEKSSVRDATKDGEWRPGETTMAQDMRDRYTNSVATNIDSLKDAKTLQRRVIFTIELRVRRERMERVSEDVVRREPKTLDDVRMSVSEIIWGALMALEENRSD